MPDSDSAPLAPSSAQPRGEAQSGGAASGTAGARSSKDLAHRVGPRLYPDSRRVITRLFVPGEETPHGRSRAALVLSRILALDESEVVSLSNAVIDDFRGRHHDLAATFSDHFAVVAGEITGRRRLSSERRMLIGACFTQEFSPESAALCNPSMVAHPDQTNLGTGQLRFLMSVRSVGEGHLSSIGFRTGALGPAGALVVDPPHPLLVTGRISPAEHQLAVLQTNLTEQGVDERDVSLLLGGLKDSFNRDELNERLDGIHPHTRERPGFRAAVDQVLRLSEATYNLEFPETSSLTGRLVWPQAPQESRGMEDARLVRFVGPDGIATYYATYTAYDGFRVAPHLLATQDFLRFHMSPLGGMAAKDKGLALFPRQVQGRYLALSRWDRETTSLCTSDDLRIWHPGSALRTNPQAWETIQVGNCGSPIETAEGWLVLTHGVGPMRVYSIGAMLLDLNDPSRVLRSLDKPLLVPDAAERDGYVPNVVYSCGGLVHDDVLTIPYGISDASIGFAQISIGELISAMRPTESA